MNLFRVYTVFIFLYYKLLYVFRKKQLLATLFEHRGRFDKSEYLEAIHQLRDKLIESADIIDVTDFGAGSDRMRFRSRHLRDIARVASTKPYYGQLFTEIVKQYRPQTIIELGSCLGLGTMYLAAGNPLAKVITLEGCPNLAAKARENFETLRFKNIDLRQGNFDDLFDFVLAEVGSFDLLFVDGNHRYNATIDYFNRALKYANAHSILIFDDIYWSEGMNRAWREICSMPSVSLSVDFFRFGMVFLNPELEKQHIHLYY